MEKALAATKSVVVSAEKQAQLLVAMRNTHARVNLPPKEKPPKKAKGKDDTSLTIHILSLFKRFLIRSPMVLWAPWALDFAGVGQV